MAVTITSTADKEVTVILADAQKKSEIMKGEGDGQKNKIFADAFGQDPEFFGFYRAMQAYQNALIGGETAEMPGVYSKDKFDLAGFSVGIVSKKKNFKQKER